MAQKNPTSVANKWNAGMQNAGPAYTEGVQAVKTAPGQLAAAAADLWAQNVAAAKGKFAMKSQAVSLNQWQQDTVNKGAPRLAEGAQNALPKFTAFMSSYLPKVYAMVGQLPARGTYAQNKARANAMMDALHNAAGTFAG